MALSMIKIVKYKIIINLSIIKSNIKIIVQQLTLSILVFKLCVLV